MSGIKVAQLHSQPGVDEFRGGEIGVEPGDIFFVHHYMDDDIMYGKVEVQVFKNGVGLKRAAKSPASDDFRLFGVWVRQDALPLSPSKMLDWSPTPSRCQDDDIRS